MNVFVTVGETNHRRTAAEASSQKQMFFFSSYYYLLHQLVKGNNCLFPDLHSYVIKSAAGNASATLVTRKARKVAL